jgi:hypothetical protein
VTGLRVWTRPEISTTAVQMAREVMHRNGMCACGGCKQVRSARSVIQQAAEPAGRTDQTT